MNRLHGTLWKKAREKSRRVFASDTPLEFRPSIELFENAIKLCYASTLQKDFFLVGDSFPLFRPRPLASIADAPPTPATSEALVHRGYFPV